MFIGLASIFFSQLAVQTIEYLSLKTIIKTYINVENNDIPMVTFMFKDKINQFRHKINKKQYNISGQWRIPRKEYQKEIEFLYSKINQVMYFNAYLAKKFETV